MNGQATGDSSEIVVSGPEFLKLLEKQWRRQDRLDAGSDLPYEIPTGPGEPIHVGSNTTLLVVADSIDLRGHVLNTSTFVYGVVFRGRVDMRDVTVKGSIDFSGCVFEEGLTLNDATIEGTLRLTRVSTTFVRLVSVVIQGRLDMNGSKISTDVVMHNARVDGYVDLRGVSAGSILMRGSLIGSDLRIGRDFASIKSPGYISFLDATNSEIGGRVLVLGTSSADVQQGSSIEKPEKGFVELKKYLKAARWSETRARNLWDEGLRLILDGASVKGSFHIGPFFTDVHDTLERTDEYLATQADTQIAWPSLREVRMVDAKIDGAVFIRGAEISGYRTPLNMSRASIGGSLNIEAGRVLMRKDRTDTDAPDFLCKECVFTQRNANGEPEVGREVLNLSGAKIGGGIRFVGVTLRGTALCSGMDVSGIFNIDLFADGDRNKQPFERRCDFFGLLDLSVSNLGMGLFCYALRVRGNLSAWGVISKGLLSFCLRAPTEATRLGRFEL